MICVWILYIYILLFFKSRALANPVLLRIRAALPSLHLLIFCMKSYLFMSVHLQYSAQIIGCVRACVQNVLILTHFQHATSPGCWELGLPNTSQAWCVSGDTQALVTCIPVLRQVRSWGTFKCRCLNFLIQHGFLPNAVSHGYIRWLCLCPLLTYLIDINPWASYSAFWRKQPTLLTVSSHCGLWAWQHGNHVGAATQ